MADNDFMDCPSPTAEGRHDRCGQFASPRHCWNRSCSMPDAKPTPNPSITVGTQVRLTGVVEEVSVLGELEVRFNGGDMTTFLTTSEAREAEVIRQPFKRGEVVYSKISATNEEPYVVLNDETLGMVDVACCRTGFHIPNDNAEAYERRPSRPKEER